MREVVVAGQPSSKARAPHRPARRPGPAGRQPPHLRRPSPPPHRVDISPERSASAGRAVSASTRAAQPNCPPRPDLLRPLAAGLEATVAAEEEGQQGVDRRHRHADAHGVAEKDVRGPGGREDHMKMITTGDIKISVLVAKADGHGRCGRCIKVFELQPAPARRRLPGPGDPARSARASPLGDGPPAAT